MPQQTDQVPQITAREALRPRLLVSRPVIGLGTIAVLVALLGGSIWMVLTSQSNHQVIVTNGAERWANDHRTTAASIPFAAPETLQIAVDPAFTAYYQAHDGPTLLGAPVTPGFPIAQGWIQFFTANALLLPGRHGAAPTRESKADQQIERLMQDGLKDRQRGIIQLPLLQTLLTVGSQAHLLGSGLTYADLRNATHPNQMRFAPTTATTRQRTSQGVFVQEGTRDGNQVGHVIPEALWAYITRPDVSPDGWQSDVGAPLTEAIPLVTVQYGVSHRLLVQAFWREVLVMDRDDTDAAGQPLMQPLETGVAYLQTLTPPAPVLGKHAAIWASRSLDILTAPATGSAILRVGQYFPLTLAGDPRWNAGTLWYHVQWQVPKNAGAGWAPALGITFMAPITTAADAWSPASGNEAHVPAESSPWASLAQLSPDLAQYLASQGNTTAAVVYDLTRQRYYATHLGGQYLMGNTVKLPIVVAFLAMKEQQGLRPSAEEMKALTTMLVTNDVRAEDDEAGEAIYNAIGRALGLKEYLNQVGITGLTPENDDLLYSLTQPLAIVQLLTLLEEGHVLTAQDRALVFSWLSLATPDQQVGVGDTRPTGANVAMKDGWVMGTDDRWAMNTSGIVTLGSETYVIAVFSAHLNALSEGQDIARQVCTRVAALLT